MAPSTAPRTVNGFANDFTFDAGLVADNQRAGFDIAFKRAVKLNLTSEELMLPRMTTSCEIIDGTPAALHGTRPF